MPRLLDCIAKVEEQGKVRTYFNCKLVSEEPVTNENRPKSYKQYLALEKKST